MILYCPTCGLQISENVELLKDNDFTEFEYEKDCIPKGFVIIFEQIDNEEFFGCRKGDYLLNLDDMKNLQDHTISLRLVGCCGIGSGGINKLCLNGHEVGTEHSDCSMPRFFSIESAKIFDLET